MKTKDIPSLLARLLSAVLHPQLVALWAVAVVVSCGATTLSYEPDFALFVVATVAGMTVLTPMVFAAILRLFGLIRAGQWGSVRSRRLLLSSAAICFAGCGAVFADFVVLFVVRKLMFTAAVMCLVLLLLEWLWRVSIHTFAMGSVVGILWVLLWVGNVSLLWPFLCALVLGGVLCSARVLLHPEREPWRAIVGLVGGFAASAMAFIVL